MHSVTGYKDTGANLEWSDLEGTWDQYRNRPSTMITFRIEFISKSLSSIPNFSGGISSKVVEGRSWHYVWYNQVQSFVCGRKTPYFILAEMRREDWASGIDQVLGVNDPVNPIKAHWVWNGYLYKYVHLLCRITVCPSRIQTLDQPCGIDRLHILLVVIRRCSDIK